MINHGPLILPFFSTPWAIWQFCMVVECMGMMNPFWSHNLWQLWGGHKAEKSKTLRWTPQCTMVIPEVFPSSLNLLDFIDLWLQEVSRCNHLPKEAGETVGSLLVKSRVMCLKILCLVTCTRSVSWQKASQWFSLRPMKNFPSFHFQWVGSSVGVAGLVASSLDEQHCHLHMGVANAVAQGVAGAGSPIVVDGWGKWPREWTKTCSPSAIVEGTWVFHMLLGDRPAVLLCRQLEKTGDPSLPPQWLPSPFPVYIPHVTVVGCRCPLNRLLPPPW